MSRTPSPDGVVVWRLDEGTSLIRWSAEHGRGPVLGVDVSPGDRRALDELHAQGGHVVAVTDANVKKSDRATISQYLDGIDVLDEKRAVETLSASHGRTGILVSSDRVRRALAVDAGLDAAPSLALAALKASDPSVRLCLVSGRLETIGRVRHTVQYHLERSKDGSWNALLALTPGGIERAAGAGLTVVPLELDLTVEDPVFVHVAPEDANGWRSIERLKVIYREPGRALLAVSDAQPNDAIPVHGAHGHFVHLSPLESAGARPAEARQAVRGAAASAARLAHLEMAIRRIDPFPFDLLAAMCDGTAASFQADVDRYSGVSALDAAGTIASRHILHPDNVRVVDALVADLRAIGYCVYRHPFTHGGRTLHNVIADLPGKGCLRLAPDVLERIRAMLIRWPQPDPPDPWRKRIVRLLGAKWMAQQGFARLSPLQLRLQLELLCGLLPWYPWWRCRTPGPGADLVLVGCHLDSTAASSAGYQPATDPAPGADDDASGIAATLAAARHLWQYRGRLRHTVRFCFFNAEEQGMIGSDTYASMLAASNAPVKAVICADMVAFNSNADRIFEVHAGYTDPIIRDQNLPAANVIAAWGSSLGALPPAQIYSGTIAASGADRTIYDGAINRSDHASFHRHGFPAVVVSEDFFANAGTEPLADPNPNYHRSGDTVIDAAYGSDISCAIAHAAVELAS